MTEEKEEQIKSNDEKFQDCFYDNKSRNAKEWEEHAKECFKEVYGGLRIEPEQTEGSDGFALIPGRIKDSDGKEYFALLDIDVSSSGEFWGGQFLHPREGFMRIHKDEMKEKLTEEERNKFNPIRYHLHVDVHGDIHQEFQY